MKDFLKKLDGFFADLFVKKAPGLPEKTKKLIVKVTPWVALVLGVLALPGILAGFGFGVITSPFWALEGARSMRMMVSFLVGAAQVVIQLLAVPHLFKAGQKGWQLLYYSTLLGMLSSVFYLSGFGIVFSGVVLYLLYQVKGEYK